MIALEHVSKSFHLPQHTHQAVQSVSLQIEEGEIHGIIGKSGAGKSTLLRLINLLEHPDEGCIVVGGQVITQLTAAQLRIARRSMGMIFQQYHLVRNRTAGGNVAIPLMLAGCKKKERVTRVQECLQYVGLLDKIDSYPAQLSGGQQQRVAIARALASGPQILLCDEPTSSLDPHTTNEILDVLRQINQDLGVTIVIVTHEREVIKSICGKVSVMDKGYLTGTYTVEDALCLNIF